MFIRESDIKTSIGIGIPAACEDQVQSRSSLCVEVIDTSVYVIDWQLTFVCCMQEMKGIASDDDEEEDDKTKTASTTAAASAAGLGSSDDNEDDDDEDKVKCF